MGTNINESIYLEFYGLPGCGKSTISHMAAEELRKNGNRVIEPTYDLDHRNSGINRKLKKIWRLVVFSVAHPKKSRKLRKLIKENEYSGAEALSQAANIASKLWAYYNAAADFVIFDEGLSQSAISLAKNTKKCPYNEQKLYELIKERKILKYYIKVDTETAIKRMMSREKHDSRIEKMNDSDKYNAIKAFEARCEELYTSGKLSRLVAFNAEKDAVLAVLDSI